MSFMVPFEKYYAMVLGGKLTEHNWTIGISSLSDEKIIYFNIGQIDVTELAIFLFTAFDDYGNIHKKMPTLQGLIPLIKTGRRTKGLGRLSVRPETCTLLNSQSRNGQKVGGSHLFPKKWLIFIPLEISKMLCGQFAIKCFWYARLCPILW